MLDSSIVELAASLKAKRFSCVELARASLDRIAALAGQPVAHERVMSGDEFKSLLAACTNEDQRDLLNAARLTAARPEDLRNLTWGMVKWDQRCWVLFRHKTATTQKERKPRIVPMVEAVEQLLRRRRERLAEPADATHVFLNDDGGPWSPDDMSQWFRRLRELRDLAVQQSGRPLPDLSMGMTGDFEVAIEEGATLVRIGTRLFGARTKGERA